MVMASMSAPRQNEVAMAVDPPAPAGRNDRGRIELLDDGGPDDRYPDVEPVALVERRLGHGTVHQHLAATFDPGCERARRRQRRFLARLVFGHHYAQPQAIADDLDRALLRRMAVNLGMAFVEFLPRG